MIRDEFVAMARSYVGTPFHHQGRLPEVGLDCAGVVVCAARACGYDVQDVQGYGRIPANGLLEQAVLSHCDQVPIADARNGDIMLFAFRNEPQHLAIYADGMIIHAYMQVNKVVENSLDDVWRSRLRGCYRLRGMD